MKIEKTKNKLKPRKIFATSLLFVILILSLIIIILKPFQISLVSGQSMSPTLKNGEILFMTKGIPTRRNQIISVKYPQSWINEESDTLKNTNKNKHIIKRAVGLPGDKITIKNNKVYINGKKYLDYTGKYDNVTNINQDVNEEFILKDDEYFIMGDNTSHSNDSLYRLLTGKQNYIVNKKYIEYRLNDEK